MKRLATLLTMVLLAAGTLPAPAQGPVLTTFNVGPTTVSVSALASNLDTIWELLWGPDNLIWMTERNGRISQVDPGTGRVSLLLAIPDVAEIGESGLLGMALHPQFNTSPYVYVVYNYNNSGALREKLVRYTYLPATGRLVSPLVLLGNINAAGNHSGSRLLILPDLTLLMTTGDAQQQPDAQNTASLNGKILRLNLDGTIPTNNPIAGNPVYTYGHRNPQGLTLGPGGRIFSSEHGNTIEDEINLIEAGRNYGWPTVEGYCNLPAEAAFCASNNVREPLITWTPTIAPAGLVYYNHPAIPGWQSSLLLAVLKDHMLTQLSLNAAGTGISTHTNFLTTFGRLRSICVSPQGQVYVGTSNLDGRGVPAATDDRILVLENRAFVPSATRSASAFDFSLWPNPARGQATVQLTRPTTLVTVRDLLGRPVQAWHPAPNAATLELKALPSGVYLVQANGPGGSATRRLVVE
jgi:glucose/arabinose dehydrogenase